MVQYFIEITPQNKFRAEILTLQKNLLEGLKRCEAFKLIREEKTYQIPSVIQSGTKQGMQTLDQSLFNHVMNGLLDRMVAEQVADNPRMFATGVGF